MNLVNILHLTDIHFGQRLLESRWSQIEKSFLGDLDYLIKKLGSISIIVFTGDIADTGDTAQFERGTAFIELVRSHILSKTGKEPHLFVVPGNHDLVRPNRDDPSLLALLDPSSLAAIDKAYETPGYSSYKSIIAAALEDFSRWQQSDGLKHTDFKSGLLPGDFIRNLEINNIAIGIMGLNTTFLQLASGNFEGKLAILPNQLDHITRLANENMFEMNDVNILLTHQPLNWLMKQARENVDELVFEKRLRTSLHFFGHVHDPDLRGASRGGGATRYYFQGKSLSGIEDEENSGKQEREHGYEIITLKRLKNQLSVVVTPRAAFLQQEGGWTFDKDLSGAYELSKGISTPPFLLPLKSVKAPNRSNSSIFPTQTLIVEGKDEENISDKKSITDNLNEQQRDLLFTLGLFFRENKDIDYRRIPFRKTQNTFMFLSKKERRTVRISDADVMRLARQGYFQVSIGKGEHELIFTSTMYNLLVDENNL